MIYTLTLNPAIDKTVFVDDFRIDKVNRVKRSVMNIGGKGINVSKQISSLGGESKAIALLGKDSIPFFEKNLQRLGIDYMLFQNGEKTRLNTKVVDEKNQTFTDINEKSYLEKEEILLEVEEYLKENMASGDAIVLSGSLPEKTPIDIYRRFIDLARGKGVLSFLDVDGEVLRESLKTKVDFIKPNINELSEYLNKLLNDEVAIIRETKSLLDNKVDKIILSMGENGSMLLSKDVVYRVRPNKVEVKSTVGAGDSLLGGFVYGIMKGNDSEFALKQGVASSLASIGVEGSEMASFRHIEKMKEIVKIDLMKQ